MKVLLTALLGLLIFAVPAGAATGDDTPQWVLQAAASKVPTYDKDVPAVVLVKESNITISSDGRVNKIFNYAIRVLRREGREFAAGHVGYIPDVGKVKDFRAWLIQIGRASCRER